MPVIQVTAPKASDSAQDAARLRHLCGEVATALGLPPSGVVAVLCEAALTSTGDGIVAAWPLAVVHGSDRGRDATRRALDAAGTALAQGWGVPRAEVWAEWAGSLTAGD
ncbi:MULTISPECIES: hypothetical protein [unclassified Streptomyces]|uniref:hypothetical protein n=1 Tax=unclassified Streptomyces TaxID=2593676 RepID=UPI000DBA2795|nr:MULTISPECIES: hypothetical protein [unclassified Streptomyces]MYT69173.1 hypothetical protein [Streptomyces sp. SID8367]RAJ82688.1 hypothetical protein K377_04409 [Streptomyces sp. PsTaAH-137]